MNKHILVTEDDKNVADGLREILESDGYTVSCADCASAAMQTCLLYTSDAADE